MVCGKETRGVPRTFADENNDLCPCPFFFFWVGRGGGVIVKQKPVIKEMERFVTRVRKPA